VLESEAGIQKDDSAAAPSGLWVMNLEEYLNSLEDFTGIIEASDGAIVFTFWVKRGEVKAAKLVDGDFVVTGNSVLYFSSIPASDSMLVFFFAIHYFNNVLLSICKGTESDIH